MKTKKQSFYIFFEHADYIGFLKEMGGKVEEDGDNLIIRISTSIYKEMTSNDLYAGEFIVFMRLPEMSYSELIYSLCSSKICADDIIGIIGLLLKKYNNSFRRDLFSNYYTDKQRRKICKSILWISKDDFRVKRMAELLKDCKDYVRETSNWRKIQKYILGR